MTQMIHFLQSAFSNNGVIYYLIEWENGENTWCLKSDVGEDLAINSKNNNKVFGPGVEKVLSSRRKGGREQLKVAWRKRPLHEASWVDKNKMSKQWSPSAGPELRAQ